MAEETANILVIDDEVGMRGGCRRALASHNYLVSTAEHGAEGLRKLREAQWDASFKSSIARKLLKSRYNWAQGWGFPS